MSYTKEQLVEQLQATLDILNTPTTTPTTDAEALRKVFLLGMQHGVSRAYDKVQSDMPSYTSIYIDLYEGNLQICGDIELDSDKIMDKVVDHYPSWDNLEYMHTLSGFENDDEMDKHIDSLMNTKGND
jgi:hypothetical protein